ncbi:hypothetical protein ACIG0C_30235 [Kitasatospora aureofaciens]|uniref:hypothetical protein n=1 Tax=Kitasatospora TaxID=2063 RepID=UPI00114CCE54|nr:hypothetical protein [Kitasatospora aureofaciens]
MGFIRREGFVFEQVVSDDNVIYDAYTDDDGVVHLSDDYEPGLEIRVAGVVIGGFIYEARTDEWGRVYLVDDEDYC